MDDARGAEILTGGTGSADRAGWFCAPTVVAALTRHAAVGGGGFRSGGVLYLSPPSTKPLALANNGEFGLGSAFWSSDPAEIDRVVAGRS